MFADVLNAPISKLTMREKINICQYLFDGGALRLVSRAVRSSISKVVSYLFIFNAILKDVLYHQASGFS